MDKISFELQTEMEAKPSGEFDVIVTLIEGCNLEAIHLKDYRILMDTIWAAKLTVKEIKDLAKNKNVISIEIDAQMKAL